MRLLYTQQDGTVAIVTAKTLEDAVKAVPEGVPYREIQDADIPVDRTFRNAWVDVTPQSSIDIDCEKAKEEGLKILRGRRDKELTKTDAEYVMALSKGDSTSPILAKKVKLRDSTNSLKALDVAGKVNDESTLATIYAETFKLLQ